MTKEHYQPSKYDKRLLDNQEPKPEPKKKDKGKEQQLGTPWNQHGF